MNLPKKLLIPLLTLPMLLMAACGGLSDEEKAMIGNYYIPAVSDTHPMIELRADRSAVLRAIRPGDISYSVPGKWKLHADSLVIVTDPTSITVEDGDPALVGTVAKRVAYPIKSYNETTLTIERQGITYDYHRRLE